MNPNAKSLNGSTPTIMHDMMSNFALTDPATGKRRPIRDMTDAELARHAQDIEAAHHERSRTSMALLAQLVDVNHPAVRECVAVMNDSHASGRFLAVLNFEKDRRASALASGVSQ